MILSDADIRRAIQEERLKISPTPAPEQFAPSALDLRVGTEFKRWKSPGPGARLSFNLSEVHIPSYEEHVEDVQLDANGRVVIPDDSFILAMTLERIDLPLDLAARVEGRSSFARLGLAVHITAPTIHAGFCGPIVLEIKNLGPHVLMIEPGKTCVCQLIFEQLSSKPTGPLKTDFQDQTNVLGSGKG